MTIEDSGSGDRAKETTNEALKDAEIELSELKARQENGEDVIDEIKQKIETIRKYQKDLGIIDSADYN